MKSPSPKLAIFLIVLLDVMGFGLIIPSQPFLAKHFGASPTVVTLLGTVYSLMQFIFAPMWGSLSDRVGRRPVLLCTIAMTIAGHATFAASSSLMMLFIARALAGTGAANIATAQAVLADTHEPSERSRAMALVGAAFGLGFIFGPATGGILFHFDQRAPAAFGACLATLNLAFVFLALPETRTVSSERIQARARLSDVTSLSSELKRLITTTLLFIIAFSLMEQSVGLFIEHHWVSATDVNGMKAATDLTSLFLVVVGVTATITQGVLVRKWLKTKAEITLLRAGLAVVACSLVAIPALGYIGIFPLFLLTGASLALGSGLYNPSMAGLVSLASPSSKQGFGLAVNQSAAALGRVIGPTTAGLLFAANESAPFLVGGLLALVAIAVSGKVRVVR